MTVESLSLLCLVDGLAIDFVLIELVGDLLELWFVCLRVLVGVCLSSLFWRTLLIVFVGGMLLMIVGFGFIIGFV